MSDSTEDFIARWNARGEVWVKFQPQMDRYLGALGRAAMDRTNIKAGEDVLDVGCGCGGTSLELAQRVGPTGHVVGIDPSKLVLEVAQERAKRAHLKHVTFHLGDAGTHDFADRRFEIIYSRLGVMYFNDPESALPHLVKALKPGGRVSFACWHSFDENPWLRIPFEAVAGVLNLTPPDPHKGIFSWANHDYVRGLLTKSGLTGVDFHAFRDTAGFRNADEAFEFFTNFGPGASGIRSTTEELRPKALAAIREVAARHNTTVEYAGWVVTARNA